MARYEYTVVPAPERGDKSKGLRTGAERFAYTLAVLLNDMAAEGWEYDRAETLPAEERSGLTSKTTVWHNVLIFRRPVQEDAPLHAAPLHPLPEAAAHPAPHADRAQDDKTRTGQPKIGEPKAEARKTSPPLFSAAPPVRLDQPKDPSRLGPAKR